VVYLPNNLGEIDELKIAIDSLYSIDKAVNTIFRITNMWYFENPITTMATAKSVLTNLKKKLADL